MRPSLLLVAALGSIVTAAAASFDLRGTTSTGDRSEPQTVVWLDAPARSAPMPAGTVAFDQRNFDFLPHVLTVRVGAVVQFPNNDRVFHNVFSFHDGKQFDLGLYPVGTKRRVTFDRPGISRIFCNIHPNMGAHVIAVEMPFCAVSDADGRFTIAAVPPGPDTYPAWRPGRPELTGVVAIGPAPRLELQWE